MKKFEECKNPISTGLIKILSDQDDKDLKELGEVFRERCQNKMTHEEYEEYVYNWYFKTNIIQEFRYNHLPPKPTEYNTYLKLGKDEKRTIDNDHITNIRDQWLKACDKRNTENKSNIYWLKKFKKTALKYNDEGRLLILDNLMSDYSIGGS